MGLYDRDYGRPDPTPWQRAETSFSITTILIIINVVVYFVDTLFPGRAIDPLTGQVVGRVHVVSEWLAVYGETLLRPWMWWQFLTYGFAHSPDGIQHLLFNMIGLYVFGSQIEQRMGRMEYLRFYLIAVVLGGIVGGLTSYLSGFYGPTVGASGAVIATAILFACYYPHREILLMFVFPVKAWVLAVFFVLADLAGALGIFQGMGNTAFTVHLAGAFFALGYFFLHWNLRWLDLGAVGNLPRTMQQRSRRMKLKLHDPDKKLRQEAVEADRILAKIHESGESSLTSAERRTLERYSRRQRERRD